MGSTSLFNIGGHHLCAGLVRLQVASTFSIPTSPYQGGGHLSRTLSLSQMGSTSLFNIGGHHLCAGLVRLQVASTFSIPTSPYQGGGHLCRTLSLSQMGSTSFILDKMCAKE